MFWRFTLSSTRRSITPGICLRPVGTDAPCRCFTWNDVERLSTSAIGAVTRVTHTDAPPHVPARADTGEVRPYLPPFGSRFSTEFYTYPHAVRVISAELEYGHKH